MNKIIIGFILVVVVIGGLFLFTRGQNQMGQQPMPKPSQQSQPKVEANTIIIKDFSFNPNVLTVKQGTKVTWVNQDSVTHRIKSDTFNSKDLNSGDQFEFTFETKGSFDYICGIHPSMSGKIVVE